MGEACNAGTGAGRLKRRTVFDQLLKGRLLDDFEKIRDLGLRIARKEAYMQVLRTDEG